VADGGRTYCKQGLNLKGRSRLEPPRKLLLNSVAMGWLLFVWVHWIGIGIEVAGKKEEEKEGGNGRKVVEEEKERRGFAYVCRALDTVDVVSCSSR
jgi:hypothetical protein